MDTLIGVLLWLGLISFFVLAIVGGLRIHGKDVRKIRTKLCDDLRAIGLEARLVEGRRPEKHPTGDLKGTSIGLIEIVNSPIRWVNVLKGEKGGVPAGLGVAGTIYTYSNVYIVPDASVCAKEPLEAKSVQVGSGRESGEEPALRWQGNLTNNIMKRLNDDELLKQSLISLSERIGIWSCPKYGCWAIWSYRHERDWFVDYQPPPSREQWDCYETIARYLLQCSN